MCIRDSRVAPADIAGVDRGADAGHDAAAEQPGHLGGDVRCDLGALPGRDQRLLGEGADAESRGELLAGRGEGHLLPGVVGVEAVPGPPAQTGPALPAHRTPVEDHEVAGLDVGDAVADRLDDARGLVAEQEGKVVADAALLVVQVGVAHPAGLDAHDRLSGAGVGHHDRLDPHRLVLAGCDHTAYFLRHGADSFVGRGPSFRPYARLIGKGHGSATSGA